MVVKTSTEVGRIPATKRRGKLKPGVEIIDNVSEREGKITSKGTFHSPELEAEAKKKGEDKPDDCFTCVEIRFHDTGILEDVPLTDFDVIET
ncbi:hypothetical protein ACFLZS_01065 [Patescibacteria group bacterium]